jgi:hypothetical protein
MRRLKNLRSSGVMSILRVSKFQLNAFGILVLMLSASVSGGQTASAPPADAEYTKELVTLITALQKNPWRGWNAGTEVTLRYLVEHDAEGKPLAKEQPDLVFKVTEADKLFEITQVIKNKPVITEFLVKDQEGLDVAGRRVTDPKPFDLEIDGFKLPALINQTDVREFPGRGLVIREWVLASHPSLVLRKEVNGEDWHVTSVRVKKTIGDKEFSCIEIKKSMRFFSDGPSQSVTTQYRCPGVPGHVAEEIQEFFRIRREGRSFAPYQVVHQKVVEIKFPGSAR